MEDLLEFLFGASGRINRAKYWRLFLIYLVAGLLAAVILFTAAGIAAPIFIIMVVLVLIPWLLWDSPSPRSGCMIATRARGGCWCSTGFRQRLASLRKLHGLRSPQEQCCIPSWPWQVLHFRSGDLLKSDAWAAPSGRTHMGPTRSQELNDRAEQ